MSSEQRLKIKRAILSELNTQLAQKTQQPKDGQSTNDPRLPNVHVNKAKSNPRPVTATQKVSKPARKTALQKENTSTPKPKKSKSVPPKPSAAAVLDGLMEKLHKQDLEKVCKYAERWKHLTFGHTSLPLALNVYRKSLIKSCWQRWCEHVWEEKNEWRLIVRADCHRRFILKDKYWEQWRLFIAENRVRQHKIQLADEFASKFVLKVYFQRLKQSVSMRKDRAADKFLAETIYNKNLLRSIVSDWKQALTEQRKEQQKEGLALHFWALSLERRALLSWVQYKNNQKVKHEIKSIVDNIANQKLMKQMVAQWISYRRHRKIKSLRSKKGEKLLMTKLQHKYFYAWNDMFYISSKSKAMEGQISEMRNRSVCRRLILKWVGFVELQKHAEHQKLLAEEHHLRSEKFRYFEALRGYNAHQKDTDTQSKKAVQFYKDSVVRNCLKIWSDKLEAKEEEKIKFRTMMARKHFAFKLKQQCFSQLLEYADYRKDRKDLYQLANEQYQTNLLQHAISDWHIYRCYRKSVEVKKQSAEAFRTDLLYHKYFYVWIKMYKVKLDQDQDERVALLHKEQTLLTMAWRQWGEACCERVQLKEKRSVSEEYDRVHTLGKAFKVLRDYNRIQSSKMINKIKSADFLAQKQKLKAFEMWKEYSRRQKIKHLKTLLATSHHGTKMSQRALLAWLQYHSKIKQAKLSLRTVEDNQVKNMQLKCFQQWREEIHERRTSVRLNNLASQHYQHKVLGEIVTSWLSYTEQKARQDVNKMVVLEEARVALCKLKLSQAFHRWSLLSREVKIMRDKWEYAEEHHRHKLLVKTMISLVKNSNVCFKKRLMKQQLILFKSKVARRWFSKWRGVCEERARENQKTADALWFW